MSEELEKIREQIPETARKAPEAAPAVPEGAPRLGEERNFAGEVADLLREFPEVRGSGPLPDEVVMEAARNGTTLLEAYRAHAMAVRGGEHASGRNERQWRAPVRGVSGTGAVEDRGRDPFMSGFDATFS